MIRHTLFRKSREKPGAFRRRSHEMFRIEGLSDAVFAFSVTLLAASLEVPQTFHELRNILWGAIPFFITVTLVFLFWYLQYIFFRNYGMNDRITILLNLAYITLVVFYIYPLKFLFSLLISMFTGLDMFPKATASGETVLTQQEFPGLIMLFSAGYMLIWLILYLLHRHALQSREKLALDRYEINYTKKEMRGATGNACIGGFSLVLAYFDRDTLSGLVYLLIPVLLYVNHRVFKKTTCV